MYGLYLSYGNPLIKCLDLIFKAELLVMVYNEGTMNIELGTIIIK
jgi:hypothetical protein